MNRGLILLFTKAWFLTVSAATNSPPGPLSPCEWCVCQENRGTPTSRSGEWVQHELPGEVDRPWFCWRRGAVSGGGVEGCGVGGGGCHRDTRVESTRHKRLRFVQWVRRTAYTRLYSLRFSCKMVSLTAANTKRMFSVSVAHVKWE